MDWARKPRLEKYTSIIAIEWVSDWVNQTAIANEELSQTLVRLYKTGLNSYSRHIDHIRWDIALELLALDSYWFKNMSIEL